MNNSIFQDVKSQIPYAVLLLMILVGVPVGLFVWKTQAETARQLAASKMVTAKGVVSSSNYLDLLLNPMTEVKLPAMNIAVAIKVKPSEAAYWTKGDKVCVTGHYLESEKEFIDAKIVDCSQS